MFEPEFLPDDYRKQRITRWLRSTVESRAASRITTRFERFAAHAVAHPSRSAAAMVALAIISASAFRLVVGPHAGAARAGAATVSAQHSLPLQQSQSSAALPMIATVRGAAKGAALADSPEYVAVHGNPASLGKSGIISSDVETRKHAQDFIAQAESQLHLQSILAGPRPRALVNGKVVERGDVVASFRVLEIEPRRIIVEREGIRLVIPIN